MITRIIFFLSWPFPAKRGDASVRVFSLLEGVAAEEFDLVKVVIFISCNGSAVAIYVLYSIC